MARILLVDDDLFYRGALRNSLRLGGHDVVEAENGAEAQRTLKGGRFDLVITDIRMPEVNGIELLQWIKKERPLPVILITGFSELLETRKAAELGADEFLLKPFKAADIEASIAKVLSGNARDPKYDADLDGLYSKIPLEDFISGSRICFDIYLRITEKRYLKIAYGGEDLSVERIRSYKRKGLKHLFLTRADFAKYVGFNLSLAKRVGATSSVSDEKRRNFLRHSSEVILEQLFLEGADTEEFNDAREFAESTLTILQDNDEAFAMLEALNHHADFVYAQSLGVSVYGIMVAKALKWTSTPTLFRVSLSGLLHDLGLKEVDRAIIDKPRSTLSAEERAVYETHPIRAMELLNQIRGIPADVILVAYQHHENWVGFGYPQKLPRGKTHPLARLVHIVDLFCDCVVESPGNPRLSAEAAIKQMSQFYESSLDPAPFAALKFVFGLGPPPAVA